MHTEETELILQPADVRLRNPSWLLHLFISLLQLQSVRHRRMATNPLDRIACRVHATHTVGPRPSFPRVLHVYL